MAFVLFWLKKKTGLYLEEFGDVLRVGYLSPSHKQYSHIFVEFSNVNKALHVLYVFHEHDMQQTLDMPETADVSGYLEQYLGSEAERRTRKKLQSCAHTLRLFGHEARVNPINPLSLLVDQENEFIFGMDGKLQQRVNDHQDEETAAARTTTRTEEVV